MTSPTDSQSGARSRISLAVYNKGSSLVRDRRTITLQEGINTINFPDVTRYINPRSVTFTSRTDPEGTLVLEQNYIYDLVSRESLLRRYQEQQIEITLDDGTRLSGQLLISQRIDGADGSSYDLIVRLPKGQIVAVRLDRVRDMRFPDLPEGLITRPTLRWLVHTARRGDQEIELTYLTDGLQWEADYNVLLARNSASINVDGWITLRNSSGTTFANAQVKLVAGDVQRVEDREPTRSLSRKAMAAFHAPEKLGAEQRDLFEYKLYELKRLVTVANNENKQVQFVSAVKVPVKVSYDYAAMPMPYSSRQMVLVNQFYGFANNKTIKTLIEFFTGTEQGIDADLPAGIMRIYQEDVDQAAILIGETRIKHTPKGERIRFVVGAAFDLVGERKQLHFTRPDSNSIEEEIEIRLRNHKEEETVEIVVKELLYRWTNWEIRRTSHEYTQTAAHLIEFLVPVPPGGETVLTYTVFYSWPEGATTDKSNN